MPRSCPIAIGDKYGDWQVLSRAAAGYYWRCRCICGAERDVFGGNLRQGTSRSCGCTAGRPVKHGHAAVMSPVYRTFRSMHSRCRNPSQKSYKNYGGRGITVCKRWEKFENFLADMGEPPPGMTLERRNNSKGYSPNNCVWATPAAQARNKRNVHLIDGVPATICATQHGFCLSVLYRRAKRNGTNFVTELKRKLHGNED